MCVVKVNPSLEQHLPEEEGLGDSGRSSSGGKLNSSGSGGGGKLVPAIDGSGSMVEIVSPHDILQPGLYETWLVSGGRVQGERLVVHLLAGRLLLGVGDGNPLRPAQMICPAGCDAQGPAFCHAAPASSPATPFSTPLACQVCEFCDRGSLADLVATGKLSPDPAQRDIWAVLCLLDIALGLEYLHSNSLVRACGFGEVQSVA